MVFSGGLDSMLAVKLLQKQGVKVTGLCFESYFFDAQKARDAAKHIGIRLIVSQVGKEHLQVVKAPRYGYGRAMNPCIDCHAFMFRLAAQVMQKEGFDILATGEVLGQRPFSQNKRALQLIEKMTNLQNKILRPLSALKLAPTVYEEQGMVDRQLLEGIIGKGRRRQLELAEIFGVVEYPTPSGGCLLTEKEFSQKLKQLLSFTQRQIDSDFELIKFGRHFWYLEEGGVLDLQQAKDFLSSINASFSTQAHIILGRNKKENFRVEQLAEAGDILILRRDQKGPTALIRLMNFEGDAYKGRIISETKRMILRYSRTDKQLAEDFPFEIKTK